MPNFFDQADQPQASTSGNFFDQADAPAAPPKKPFGLADTWPARLAQSIYSAVTLPGDVYAGRAQVPQSANMPGGESTQNIGRVVDLATLASPTPPRAVQSLERPLAPAAPTQQALDMAVNKGFNEAKSSGAELSPTAWSTFSRVVQDNLQAGPNYLNAKRAPKTFETLAELEKPPAGSTVTFDNVHALRQDLGNIATDAVKAGQGNEARAARTAQQYLDTYLSSIPQSHIVGGDPARAASALSDAIANAAAQFRSERIQGIADVAKGNVEATNVPGQLGRQIRQGVNQFLKGPDTRGFSPAEIAQAEATRRAGRGAGITGTFLGGGGIVPAAIAGTIGGGLSSLIGLPGVGAGVPLIGAGLKALEAGAARKQLAKLDEMVRMRSPLGQQAQAAMPTAAYAPNPALWWALRQGVPPMLPSAFPPYFPGNQQ